MEYNNIIQDDDVIFEQLDKYHDGKEYEKIVSTVLEIPFENWSNKLWFRLISAYNNLREFDKAADELEKIRPHCNDPFSLSRWHYMNGYIYYANKKEMIALHCYEDGVKADPDNSTRHDLQDDMKECWQRIEKSLQNFHSIAGGIADDIINACEEIPDSEKYDLDEEELTLELGFLPGIRKIPGQERGLGFGMENYFKKFNGEEKEMAKEWLERLYGIKDRESFKEFFHNSHFCNMANYTNDAIAALNKKPNFELSELTEEGWRMFRDTTLFVNEFAEYLPEAGTVAWDICEKIGFARIAYAVDYMTNSDYCSCMIAMHDEAKARFSSVREYITSLTFGCALYMFMIDDCSIKNASNFLLQMSGYILNGDLPRIIWK